jgi:hypothetical protein
MAREMTAVQPSEADYDAILNTVMDSQRGRWFLGAFAERQRRGETRQVLDAIARLERNLAVPRERPGLELFRDGLMDMADAIARTKAEIAAIRPAGGNQITAATGELDSIVQQTEKATADILHAAEAIQEVAWTLREQGADRGSCDVIDHQATEIYTACSFQDLTAQRTRKVIHTLSFLEARIAAMIQIWRVDEGSVAAPALPLDADAMSQTDIDAVLAAMPAQRAAGSAALPTSMPPVAEVVAEAPAEDATAAPTALDALPMRDRLLAFS